MSMQSEKMTSRRGSRTRTSPGGVQPRGPTRSRCFAKITDAFRRCFRNTRRWRTTAAARRARQSLAQQICGELKIHTTLEEEIFYPAARAALGEKGSDLLDEAKVEHASAKDLIAQLEDASPTDDLFDAKVTVLGEYIKHHVKEEHEELFPKCRKARMDLKAIGAAMAARKKELS